MSAKTAKSVAQVTVRDKTCELTWLTCNCAIGSLDAAGAAVAAEISHDQNDSCSGERQRYRRGRFRNGAGCGAAVSGASRLLSCPCEFGRRAEIYAACRVRPRQRATQRAATAAARRGRSLGRGPASCPRLLRTAQDCPCGYAG